MPRNVTVTFADGQTSVYNNVPDAVTPEQITQRATQEYGGQVVEIDGGSKTASAGRTAKIVGSAAVRGVLGMPALVGDLAGAVGRNSGDMPLNPLAAPMQAVSALSKRFLGEPSGGPAPLLAKNAEIGTQPETVGEKYLASGVEGVTGAATGGGLMKAPVRTLLTGATSGVGAEAGGQLTDDSLLGRLAGALAGGAGAGKLGELFNRIRPQSADLARDAMEGITPQMMRAAEKLQEASRSNGVEMDLAQALQSVGAPAANLTAIRNALVNSRHGEETKGVLQRQNSQLRNLTDERMDQLPGTLRTSRDDSANLVADAATRRIDQARRARTDAVEPHFNSAGELGPEQVQRLVDRLDALVDRPGRTDDFLAAARSIRTRLQGTERAEAREATAALQALEAAKTPKERALAANRVRQASAALEESANRPMHAADANVAISDAVGPYKPTPLNPRDPKVTGQIKNLAGEMREEMSDLSPEIRRGNDEYRRLTQEQVSPLKRSVVGRLASNSGNTDDARTAAAKIEAVFNEGSDPRVAARARSIPMLFRELRDVDPEAVPAAAKAFLSNKLNQAFPDAPGIQTRDSTSSVNAAKAIQQNLFSNRAQSRGLRDIVDGISDSFELSATEKRQMQRGLEHFMQTTKALSNRPESIGGLNWAEISKSGGKSYLADAARIYGFLPFERVARKVEDATLARTFRDFDQILTTPEGAAMLRRLAEVPPTSNRAIYLMAQFGAVPSTASPQPTKDK